VFNVDETGILTVQQQKQKILAASGKKQLANWYRPKRVKQSQQWLVCASAK